MEKRSNVQDYIIKTLELMGIGKEENIIIWGGGARGQQTVSELRKLNIEIAGFCDRNKEKQGTLICGYPCFSPVELEDRKPFTMIFAVDNCNDFFEELCEKYENVINSQDLSLLLNNNPYTAGYKEFYPLGHFYNQYPDLEEVEKRSEELFDKNKEVKEIDFREEEQKKVLEKMLSLYASLPAWKTVQEKEETQYRYRYLNPSFSPADSVLLHCMLRILQPERMIEVGSGWSSAITLDTNEYYMDNSIDLKFIEPYPALLKSILKKSDHVELMEKGLETVSLEVFDQLQSGDLLFIDSTHVSKIGSDVNYLFFEIFPKLNRGVYIHLHDIFYPFEYPKEWIKKGMVWNELYLLRAFLMNNKDYEIVFFQNMMEQKHLDMFQKEWMLDFPVHGGSIWLRKL